MSIGIGSDAGFLSATNVLSNSSKTNNITSSLNKSGATDEELLNACKSFESYLLEQVFKGMEKTVMKDNSDEENDYLSQFGDMLYEQYAEAATENQSVGIAQMLYESMKRNS